MEFRRVLFRSQERRDMLRMGAAGIQLDAAMRARQQPDMRRLAGRRAFGRFHPWMGRPRHIQLGDRGGRKPGSVAMKFYGPAAVTIAIPGVPQDGRTAGSRQIAQIAQGVEKPVTRSLRHETIDERRGAADRTEDIVPAIAREEGIDLMLAAELFMSRRDCLHVEWRVDRKSTRLNSSH